MNSSLAKLLLFTLVFLSTQALATGVEEGLLAERIILRGTTRINLEQQGVLLDEFIGKPLYAEDLVAIRNRITQYYIDNGYLSSGAVIPTDFYANGALTIDVIEGGRPDITVSSDGRLRPRYVEQLILSELRDPLNMQDLQSAIQRAEQDVRIAYIRAELKPGALPGSSELLLGVAETNPLRFFVSANNYRSPSVGEAQAQVSVSHRNLSGHGDELSLFFAKTDGTDGGGIDYRLPVFGVDNHLHLYYVRGDTVVVEEPFDQIDVQSEIDTAGVVASHSVSGLGGQITWSAGLERKESTTSLLGLPYDFSYGYRDGESQASVFFVSGEYTRKSQQNAFVARLSYRHEIELFGLQPLPEPVADFQVLVAQLHYAHRFDWLDRDQLVFSLRLNTQLTEDVLPSFERIALGGHNSVRGYRENSLLKDNAIELLVDLDIPLHSGVASKWQLYLTPFYGYARGWQTRNQANASRVDELSSVGLGLKLSHQVGVGFQVFWGERLSHKETTGNALQDDGIQAELSYVF